MSRKDYICEMKKFMLLIFLLGILSIFFGECHISYAQNSDNIHVSNVSVAYYYERGFQETIGDDEYYGYNYEFLQKIRTYTGWDYDFVVNGQTNCFFKFLNSVENGEIDLIGGVIRTKDREEKFLFSNMPMSTYYTRMYVREGDTTYYAGDYVNWYGMKIGVLYGTAYSNKLEEFAKDKHFYYHVVYKYTMAELQEELENGNIDAIFASSNDILEDVAILEDVDCEYGYYCTSLENTELMDELNKAMLSISSLNPDYLSNLNKKYYDVYSDNTQFSSLEKMYIEQEKKKGTSFRVVINPDNCPLSYIDKNGEFAGILVDYTKNILDNVGIDYSFVDITTRKEYVDVIQNKEYDIIADFFSAYSDTGSLIKCESYYNSSMCEVNKLGNSNVQTYLVCEGDELHNLYNLNNAYRDIKKVELDSLAQVEDYIMYGEGAVIYLPKSVAQVIVEREATNSLTCQIIDDIGIDVGMAIKDDSSIYLLRVLNKSSRMITIEDNNDITKKYGIDNFQNKSLIAKMYDYPETALFIVFIIIVIIILSYVTFLNKKNLKKEAALNNSLRDAYRREKEANESKAKFFENMSHDMRTPLNAIIGLTNIAKNDNKDIDSDISRCLDKINDNSQYLLLLVEDSLDINNIENIGLVEELVWPNDLYNSLVNVATSYAKNQNITLCVRSCELINVPILVDRDRTEQIILNIISNAVKFSKEGGVVDVDIRSKMLSDNEVNYKVIIQDYGIGMSEQFIPKMFERYSKENRAGITTYAGSGLGLSVTKSLIEKMGGSISINSKENIGTLVTLSFICKTKPEMIINELKDAKEDEEISLNGLHVLVCEDNDLNNEIISAILEVENIIPDITKNGLEGLKKFEESEEFFYDAIIMDIRMPIMDGRQAAIKIRELDRADSKLVPIIALSANNFEQDKKDSIEAGMNAHLGKPIDSVKLFKELRKVIAISKREEKINMK